MTKSNENLTKERKSFKEVLVENKGKILIGSGVVLSAGLGFLCRDNIKALLRLGDNLTKGVVLTSVIATNDNERIDEVEKILIEGGVLNQAIATITGKRDRLNSKLLRFVESQGNPNSDRIIEECKRGIAKFDEMLMGCEFINNYWKDSKIDELLED